MKLLTTLTVALLAASSLANAYTLNPKGKSFIAKGPTSASKGGLTIACTSTFKGSINSLGVGTVTSATFTAGSALCSGVKATGLPWKVTATSLTTATVHKAGFTSALGNCGPNSVVLHQYGAYKSGKFTFNATFTGGCTAKSTAPLVSTPALYVTNP
ncbi:MAG TPA: hypothetical protein VGS12_12320 [Caulobacteraceae bacterium]|nr:hypothetical protein [Caulobacteraceae bacterium]